MGHSVNGRNLCGLIAGYMIIKSIVNIVLDHGFTNILMLAVSIGLGVCMLSRLKFMNYITAAVLAVMVIVHLKDNISNFGVNRHLIYLGEGVIDLICAYRLVADEDIKEFFRHG